ncbi:thioredoxin-like protein [Pyronema omphalodes]|nr:thioredoxin-like protein [Pyronema omphalodes]
MNAGMPNMGDMPIQVPIDDPNADTEWNDILRAKGIIPERPPSPTKAFEEAVQEAVKEAFKERFDYVPTDRLNELQEEFDDLDDDGEDAELIARILAQRKAEMIAQQSAPHGMVYGITKADYASDVTEASKKYPVLVHLKSNNDANIESRLVTQLFREAAPVFRDIKFCEIIGNKCIENYPESNCPTILVYKDGEVLKNLIKLGEMRGTDTRIRDFQQWMVRLGLLGKKDQRLIGRDDDEDSDEDWEDRPRRGFTKQVKKQNRYDDDDDDWE